MKIINLVNEVLGPLPPEFEFVKAICVCIVFAAIIYACLAPFAFLYNTIFSRW